MPYHVSKARFEELVEAALSELPEDFARFLEEVPVAIHDWPTAQQIRAARIPKGSTLLGLYHGRPLINRSVEDSGRLPDSIYIFQQTIENVCDDEAQLMKQVRTTVLHEIGHHFGMSEEDLERLGYG